MSLAPDIAESLPPQSKRGDWTWELVRQFPRQGEWSEEEYLANEFEGLVEFVDGMLEFLPMPTFDHQDLVAFLYEQLKKFIGERVPSEVYFAPVRVRTIRGHVREPDVAYIQAARIPDRRKPSNGADLVMEVVSGSESDWERDYREKRKEYAAAGIPEYWIVDPATEAITVLVLKKKTYQVHGEFKPGTNATSALLPGLQIDVSKAFAAAKVR